MIRNKQFYESLIDEIDNSINKLEEMESVKTIPKEPTYEPNTNINEGTPSKENLANRQSMLDLNKQFDKEYRKIPSTSTSKEAKKQLRELVDKYKQLAIDNCATITTNRYNAGIGKVKEQLNNSGIMVINSQVDEQKDLELQTYLDYSESVLVKAWEMVYYKYAENIDKKRLFKR
jgi:hypothetical protein